MYCEVLHVTIRKFCVSSSNVRNVTIATVMTSYLHDWETKWLIMPRNHLLLVETPKDENKYNSKTKNQRMNWLHDRVNSSNVQIGFSTTISLSTFINVSQILPPQPESSWEKCRDHFPKKTSSSQKFNFFPASGRCEWETLCIEAVE